MKRRKWRWRSPIFENIRDAPGFDLGAVGAGGTVSQSEQAYRKLLFQAEAPVQFRKLLSEAGPAGKMYALMGLKVRDPEYFQQVVAGYKASEESVNVCTGGCDVRSVKVSAVASSIERGRVK